MKDPTLPRIILDQAPRRRNQVALRRKQLDSYQDITWETLADQVRAFARGLLALGLQPGERVAIMAPNSPEWVFADLATLSCRGVSVPVYHTEGVPAAAHILTDSASRFLFIHSPLGAEELAAHLSRMPQLERMILLEGEFSHPAVLPLAEFLDAGKALSGVDARLAEATSEELASIVYTSGTTGLPKGVMLSHRNFLSNIEACNKLFDIDETDQCLSFLPLSHVFERMAGYYLMLIRGATIAYAESFDTVAINLAETRPTVVVSVPRLYEKMYARVMETAQAASPGRKRLFSMAFEAGREFSRQTLAGRCPSLALRLRARLLGALVFGKLRKRLGGRLRFFVSGGAPLGKDIGEFFLAAGLPIYEGYGLTETSPVIAANCPGALRLGTVGRPIEGVEVHLADDGEIMVKGPGVFAGYWNRPEETAQAFNDGWFLTGDIGKLDGDGFLTITDRKKELIITAGGENIAPQPLENLFKSDKFLSNVMIYGEGKPYLVALLVPNFELLASYAHRKKFDFLDTCDLISHPMVLSLLRRRIDALQRELPPFQRIKRFTILSRDFSRDETTPTLKLKRVVIIRHFHKVLEGMYLSLDHGIHDGAFCVVEKDED